jgi:hypothetical protein
LEARKMNQPTAIAATFHDVRTVKGRKTCQLVFEVPIEKANEALAVLGGIPNPSDPPWVAVALLRPEAVQRPSNGSHESSQNGKAWDDLSPAQQAGIRCNDAAFRTFIGIRLGDLVPRMEKMADECAWGVRHLCGVTSRSELNTDKAATDRWQRLQDDFWAWQRGMQ